MYTTVYPTAIPNRTNLPVWVDDVDDVEALVVNDPVTELLACLTHLGTMPAGSAADLTTRLAVSLNDDGSLKSTLSPTFVDLTLSGDLAVNGNDITSTGDLTLNPTGGNVIVDGNLGVQKTVPQAEGHFYGAGHCGIIIENEGATDKAVLSWKVVYQL